jgi:hypothetical protein
MRDSRARDHPTSRTGTDGAVKTAYRNGSRRQDRVQEGVASSRPRTGTGRAVKTAYRNLETDHGFGTVRAPTAFERRRGKDRRDQSSRRLAVGRDALASGRRDALASGRRDALASGRAGRPAAATVVPRGDRGPARSSLGSVGKTRGPRGASASAESLTPRHRGGPGPRAPPHGRRRRRPPPKAGPEPSPRPPGRPEPSPGRPRPPGSGVSQQREQRDSGGTWRGWMGEKHAGVERDQSRVATWAHVGAR